MGITPPTPTNPYVPDRNQGGNIIFAYDRNFKMGQNHMVDFSIQRELPGNMIMEVGYIGRLGRRLPAAYPVNADPYMFTVAGQSFAQANDCIAQTLNYGATSNWPARPSLGGIPCQDSGGNLLDQQFFENYLPAGWGAARCGAGVSNTQCFVQGSGGDMTQGNIGVFGAFGSMARINCGPLGQFKATGGAKSLADFQQCSLFNRQVTYSTGLFHNTGNTATGTCATFANQLGGGTLIGGNSSALGYNYFSDPATAFCSFRPILLSVDTRDGRDHPLRGFGLWNVDASFGKETTITERFKVKFSADFFNIFNHVSFDDPLNPFQPTGFIDATAGQAFGTITNSFTPPQRPVGSPWIQLGLRVQF